MQYQIVYASSQAELAHRVGELIQAGWRPQGGVAAIGYFDMGDFSSCWEYNQAMIKEGGDDE